jgi:UDP-N-acetylglucosamine 4,6-dehydratase
MDLARAVTPKAKIEIIGIRPGEKIHELMISSDDAINTLEYDSYFVIQPAHPWWDNLEYIKLSGGKRVNEEFTYDSGSNTQWMTIEDMKEIIRTL